MVVDLVAKLPPDSYSIYIDKFFTSLPLLEEIKKLGHDATGTIRANRVGKETLKDQKAMKKTERTLIFSPLLRLSGIMTLIFLQLLLLNLVQNL